MGLVQASIKYRTVTLVLTVTLILGGVSAFFKLGQLEDPEFTIFTAIVSTTYPGASPEEVELEVTDRIETAIQTMGQVENVRSLSRAGLSIIIVDLFTTTPQKEIPQAWDELRRKVGDIQTRLPPGAGPSVVNDDWGDVYGNFYALTGDGFSLSELEEYVKSLRKDLLQVEGVGSIELWGTQTEVIYLEMSRSRLSELGLGPQQMFQTLQTQGAVAADGKLKLGSQMLRVSVTGEFNSLQELGDLLIFSPRSQSSFRLSDVAQIHREVLDPPQNLLFFNGEPAIGLGVATVPGGNVVDTGERVEARIHEMEADRPLGMELHYISNQSETVTESVDGFVVNLIQALAIVIGLLMIFMGLRSGLLIGIVLLLDVLGTFIYMSTYDVSLQRISLGALIIALGMLVDNAIVVTEGFLVYLQRGKQPEKAALDSVLETMWPLLGATFVAIFAFGAISISDDATGEFLSSLFWVVAISLLLSWVLAVTVTPVLGILMLRKVKVTDKDPYDRPFFRAYRRFLQNAMTHRSRTIGMVVLALVAALLGFSKVKQSFFPDSSRPQFYIDYYRAEGTDIRTVRDDLMQVSSWLLKQEEVTNVSAFIGQGALRFILTYEPAQPNSCYGQLLISVKDAGSIDSVLNRASAFINERLPEGEAQVHRFVFGPGGGAKIEARFQGKDPEVLRSLALQAEQIMRQQPNLKDIRNDWRQRVPVIRPEFSEAKARLAGVSRMDVAASIEVATSGKVVGLYRDKDKLLPIIIRAREEDRSGMMALNNAQVWSSVTGKALPLGQVIHGLDTRWEDPVVHRKNRVRTLTVKCDPRNGVADPEFRRLRPLIEGIPLPSGYYLEWGGEYESSTDANRMLMASVPLFFTLMVLIVVGLFNSIRKPLIVFITLPLAVIGVTLGLLVTGQPFGFVALLGFLSLSGMLIKNAVVLLEQIDLNLEAGVDPWNAVLDAGVSRLRPVFLAAFTTILGMIPLLPDVFWSAMAVTIMAGLAFATVLTLVVVPVLYVVFFKIPSPNSKTTDSWPTEGALS
jgi:multidrug efflux pump subunit AcrB